MAKMIKFYVPDSLQQKANYKARKEGGKLIEFPSPKRNQLSSSSAQWLGMGLAYMAPFAANSVGGRTDETM